MEKERLENFAEFSALKILEKPLAIINKELAKNGITISEEIKTELVKEIKNQFMSKFAMAICS